MARSLRVFGGEVSLLACLWPIILPVSIFGRIQGASCSVPLSVKMRSRVRVSGRLAGSIVSWCLLPPFGLSQILPVGGRLSVPLPYWSSCCEITHASSYYRAWPRQAVLVNGSLTHLYLFILFSENLKGPQERGNRVAQFGK